MVRPGTIFVTFVGLAGLAACGDGQLAVPGGLDGTGADSLGTSASDGGSLEGTSAPGDGGTAGGDGGMSGDDDSDGDTSGDSTDSADDGGDSDTSGDGDGDGDGDMCETPWPAPWVGDACSVDADCHEGGRCLTESEGFPCGTCSEPCDQFCPDLEGTPTTFCVDTADLGVDPSEGACISQCDPTFLGGDGCRDGYSCVALPRFMDNTAKPVCVPDAVAPPKSDCMLELDALGISYAIADVPPDSPDTHPQLTCEIDEPVYLYPPVNNVSWRYFSAADPAPVLVSCEMALAIERLTALLEDMGCVEFEHIGTYNCRVISGTDTLSEHSFATAIDLYGFDVTGLGYLTLIDDWEDNVIPPVTPEGQWLRTLADTRYAEGIFNIILTPDYNAAHDNHFHVDLSPGGDFYK